MEAAVKKQKCGPKLLLGAFIALCLIWPIWFVLMDHVDTTNYENRERAPKPSLTASDYETYPQAVNNYIDDNLPFRNQFISLNSMVDFYLFHQSVDDRVSIGKEGWLFLDNPDEGDPMAYFQGTNLLTDAELEQIAGNLVAQRNILREMGKEFIVYIAPNKSRVYPEYVADSYGPMAESCMSSQLIRYLREHTDLRVVSPYEDLLAAKNQVPENLYYLTDTHWNALGGYVGARALLQELGISLPPIGDLTVIPGAETSGDLANMLHLGPQMAHLDREYSLSGLEHKEPVQLEHQFYGAYSYACQGADPRKLYVVRDSFGSAMAPYLGSCFSETYLRHKSTYTFEDLLAQDPDIVVYEALERYTPLLGSFLIKG